MLPTLKLRDASDGALSLMDDASGGGVQDTAVGHHPHRAHVPFLQDVEARR
jgi:hypothetical protein